MAGVAGPLLGRGRGAEDPGVIVPIAAGRAEGRALRLVPALPAPQPWYATLPSGPALDRRELEDEHTRILARAVGDHLPYEHVLRATELTAQPPGGEAAPA